MTGRYEQCLPRAVMEQLAALKPWLCTAHRDFHEHHR